MLKKWAIALLFFTAACSGADQFAVYQQEDFGEAPIGAGITKEIMLKNPSLTDAQHLTGLNFESGTNSAGHFSIDKVEVGGVTVNPRDRDISVPAGSVLQITLTYQPRNLETTESNYGGWSTGGVEIYEPKEPEEKNDDKEDEESDSTKIQKAMLGLAKKSADSANIAIHRSVLTAVYDYPKLGEVLIELVGEARPGPNGETSAAGGVGAGSCPSDAGTICYAGGFSIELPDIVSTGPKPLTLTGPIVMKSSGSNVTLDMSAFPSALLVLKGNGPGEPLEGKPINAISIIVSGTSDVTASGTFDGSKLNINGVAFRIRVVLGEITEEDITPGLQAAVDFSVKDVKIETTKPFTNGTITLRVDTNLPEKPSNNPMFDQFLGGSKVIVTMDGTLQMN